MTTPALSLALPCSRCGARAGDPCVRRDGGPTVRPHIRRTPPAPCGSYGGCIRHVKAGETPCEPCAEARRRYMAEYRKRRPDIRDKDVAQLRARREATRLLIERHRDEFKTLLSDEAARMESEAS